MQIMFVTVFHLFIRRHDQIKNQKKKKERNCTIKKQTLNITRLSKPLQVKKEALSFFIFLFIYLLSQNSSRVHKSPHFRSSQTVHTPVWVCFTAW